MSVLEVKIYNSKDFPAYLPKLNELYDDLFTGGKGFRSKLIQKISAELKLSDQAIQLLSQTIEFIHNASLLHDDLVDRSSLRRGKTTAWLKYTPEYAVLAGDYLLARVMVNLSGFGNIKLVQYTSEMISDLLEGEWLQDSLVGDLSVELNQLDRVHNLKTASLFKWCLRAPFIAANLETPEIENLLTEMGTLLGQLFQRSDDLLDFNIRNEEKKAILGDLNSGYLNSFGAYLLYKNPNIKFEKADSLENIFSKLGGEVEFNKVVNEFDDENQKLINLYHHQLKLLENHLNSESKHLIQELQPLPKILYWRKV